MLTVADWRPLHLRTCPTSDNNLGRNRKSESGFSSSWTRCWTWHKCTLTSVTLAVLNVDSGWLKALACQNMSCMFVADPKHHLDSVWWFGGRKHLLIPIACFTYLYPNWAVHWTSQPQEWGSLDPLLKIARRNLAHETRPSHRSESQKGMLEIQLW